MDDDTVNILERLNKIEGKVNEILELLNPIVMLDKELRANIKKELSHGKPPRKQPDGNAWKKNTDNGNKRN